MIDPKELRIRNLVMKDYYVNGKSEGFKIHEIAEDDFYWAIESGMENYWEEMYRPIPVEEMLIEMGFPEHRSTMNLLFDYKVCFERQKSELYIVHTDDIYQYKLDYVHQVQNIHFLLKGEEMEIKTQ